MSDITPTEIRARSLSVTTKAGLAIPASLPLLDEGLRLRKEDEVSSRLLCLTATAAASYGFDKVKALTWLRQEEFGAKLTDAERRFLERGEGNPQVFQVQIEGMWALAWALGIVSQLDFWKSSDDRFATLLPNLKIAESSMRLRQEVKLRGTNDVIAACDLAYCLHWALRKAEIEGKQPPAKLRGYVVIERRRALEWLLGGEDWDAVSLDT